MPNRKLAAAKIRDITGMIPVAHSWTKLLFAKSGYQSVCAVCRIMRNTGNVDKPCIIATRLRHASGGAK